MDLQIFFLTIIIDQDCISKSSQNSDNIIKGINVSNINNRQKSLKENSSMGHEKASNLFDVLKILRESRKRKSSNIDEKYKRFSMNNFEDLKGSSALLLDFSSSSKKPDDNKSALDGDFEVKKENQLSKSKYILFIWFKNDIEF